MSAEARVRDLFDLTGRVALVTGGSRGLGAAIARGLASAGAHVVVAARDAGRCDEVAGGIFASGGTASVQAFDLADPGATAAAIPALVQRLGQLDILVNNGAVAGWCPLEESTLDHFNAMLATNLAPTYLLCREAVRVMRPRRWGRIINLSSYVATIGRERVAAYSASKAGVEALTRSVAAEVAGSGITCNAIAPGIFDTNMAEPTVADPRRATVFRQAIAVGQFGDPEQIVGPIMFFASEASSYVTGQVLGVDGGMSRILSLATTVEV